MSEPTALKRLNKEEYLFACGTLQTEAVQLPTFGKRLNGWSDELVGYRIKIIRFDHPGFRGCERTADHRHLEFTGDPSGSVEGTVFQVTQSELEWSDAYEPDGYKRLLVQLKSGLNACVYRRQPDPTKDPY